MNSEVPSWVWEVAAVAAGVLLVGCLLAFGFGVGSKRWRESRHRKVSGSRRAKNASYDLFAQPEAAPAGPSHGRRRKRRGSSQRLKIDLLAEASKEPPAHESDPAMEDAPKATR